MNLIFTLLLFISFSLFAEDPTFIWKKYNIDISQISKSKIEKLNLVLSFIEAIPYNKLYVSEKFYKSQSVFEKLYGFTFSGRILNEWVLHRIKKIRIKKLKDFLALNTGTELILSESYFELPLLEQSLVLIHEARHSDGKSFAHITCPKDFPFLSQRNVEALLSELEACDDRTDGAYGFAAAYLFELISYYPTDREILIGKYNSELVRIITKR